MISFVTFHQFSWKFPCPETSFKQLLFGCLKKGLTKIPCKRRKIFRQKLFFVRTVKAWHSQVYMLKHSKNVRVNLLIRVNAQRHTAKLGRSFIFKTLIVCQCQEKLEDHAPFFGQKLKSVQELLDKLDHWLNLFYR